MISRAFTLASLGLVLAASFSVGTRAADLELNTPGVLTVSTEGTFPPFSMLGDDGQVDGIEIRLWKEIGQRLGLRYEPVVLKWESTLIGLKVGQFDVMGTTMDITEERQQQILYSDGWLESGGVLLVQEDSPVRSANEIEGKIIGTLAASTYAEAATAHGAGEIRSYKSEPEAYQDLVNGNVDGVITDQVAGAYAIKTSNLPLRIAEGYVSQVQKGWGFQKERPNLCRAVNEALAGMMADGTYERILTELIGISPAPAQPIRSNL